MYHTIETTTNDVTTLVSSKADQGWIEMERQVNPDGKVYVTFRAERAPSWTSVTA